MVMREAMSIMPDNPCFYFSLGVLLGKTQRLEVTNLCTHMATYCIHDEIIISEYQSMKGGGEILGSSRGDETRHG